MAWRREQGSARTVGYFSGRFFSALLPVLLVAVARSAGADVLLDEDFSGGVVPAGWTTIEGTATVEDGGSGLALKLDSGGCVELPGTFSRTSDLVIEAEVKITSATVGDFNLTAFADSYFPNNCSPVNDGYYVGIHPPGSDKERTRTAGKSLKR